MKLAEESAEGFRVKDRLSRANSISDIFDNDLFERVREKITKLLDMLYNYEMFRDMCKEEGKARLSFVCEELQVSFPVLSAYAEWLIDKGYMRGSVGNILKEKQITDKGVRAHAIALRWLNP